MCGTGGSFSNGDFASFSAAMTEALTVDPAEKERWKQKLLATHSWTKVAKTIVSELVA
jgi:hypothetical protein